MSKKANKFEFISEEKKQEYLKEIISFFDHERDEEIGFVAAEQVLDFFLTTIGDDLYKKAVKDLKELLRERIEDLEIELDSLSAE